jgi:parvulin-like peptidyl-prolyl isomerase
VTHEIQLNIERQVLELLVRDRLLVLEAQRRGIAVKDADAEEIVKRAPIFNPNGVFNAAGFQAAKVNSPELFRRALAQAKSDLAAKRLGDQLKNTPMPSEDRLRAAAERALSRTAIEYLPLTRTDFVGDYPEPRERDLLAYYHEHQSEFRRPARAVLGVIGIPTPRGREAAGRRQADSLLATLRGGASFDSAAAVFGGSDDDVVVLTGNFPGSWRLSARLEELVFHTPAGSLLPEPVPSADGWVVARVKESTPVGVAPLREVAMELRQRLRDDIRLHHDEREVAVLYQAERDSLARPAVRLRFAIVDTTRLAPGEPAAQDLDRYYRGHQADYTTYDAATGSLDVRPLEVVREDVRLRWRAERRLLLARSLADRIETAWSGGQRDRSAESSVGGVREIGPVPLGSAADTGSAGRALSGHLAKHPPEKGTWQVPYEKGAVVYQVTDVVAQYIPTLDQVRGELLQQYRERRRQGEFAATRALFEKNPQAFLTGDVVYYSSLICVPPDVMDVPLTRQEVERYHQQHLDRYASTERVRARHILISPADPSPEADREARERAEGLLRRIRAGEDFADLARRYSEDPATKPEGGDLGTFGRGVMLDAVEREAFSLKPGQVSDVFKSEAGYHILRVEDYQPLAADPLPLVYANVGADAAAEKGERIARRTADSLFQVLRTPEQAKSASERLGIRIEPAVHIIGSRAYPPEDLPRMLQLEKTAPGKLLPGVQWLRGQGGQRGSAAAPGLVPGLHPRLREVPAGCRPARRRGQAGGDRLLAGRGLAAGQRGGPVGRTQAQGRLQPRGRPPQDRRSRGGGLAGLRNGAIARAAGGPGQRLARSAGRGRPPAHLEPRDAAARTGAAPHGRRPQDHPRVPIARRVQGDEGALPGTHPRHRAGRHHAASAATPAGHLTGPV